MITLRPYHASMGPRDHSRGKFRNKMAVPSSEVLQWGRVITHAESSRSDVDL